MGAGVDRGGAVEVSAYPSDEQDRILVYTGHDGVLLRPFVQVRTAWEAADWDVRDRDDFPDDLRSFRLIVLVGTGSVGTAVFSQDQIDALSNALQRGTRIVVLQEPRTDGSCNSDAIDALVEAWDLPFEFAEASASGVGISDQTQSYDSVRSGQQATEQVNVLSMTTPCTLTSGGTWLVRDANQLPIAAVSRAGNGGDVVFVGNMDVFRKDVVAVGANDNIVFAENLAQVVP